METRAITIGTRGSRLALAQAREVVSALRTAWPGREFAVKAIRTAGDAHARPPAPGAASRGAFVKEIEEELLRGGCDIAVHSMKDLPTALPPGLAVAAVPKRADPFDLLVTLDGEEISGLPPGARIGTSSARRAALLLNLRPDLEITPIRGNVETRLRRLREGACEGVVLAAAGLARLGLGGFPVQRLVPPAFLPAPGQGCLALETRRTTRRRRGSHAPWTTRRRTRRRAPSALLAALGGGCALPVGAYAEQGAAPGTLILRGCVLSPDGREAARGEAAGEIARPEELGGRLAGRLARTGGG